ncbi:MAG: hypothetical protein J6Q76_00070 [Clostridia bacterium]|nr:hypothetical protein [Clostridia bacterium]
MKKYACLFLAFVMCIIAVGCFSGDETASEGEDIKATIVDGILSNGQSIENSTPRIYNDPDAPEKMTIEFEGETYIGTYEDTVYDVYRTKRHHNYVFANGGFDVDVNDGSFLGINFENKADENPAISIEERKTIAEDIAKKYIDVNKYVLEVDENYELFTKYVYARYFNGYKTNEELLILLEKSGKIMMVSLCDLGSFDNVESKKNISAEYIKGLNSEKGEKAATDKVVSLSEDGWNHKKTQRGQMFALSDGTVAVGYEVTMEKTYPDYSHEGNAIVESTVYYVLVSN